MREDITTVAVAGKDSVCSDAPKIKKTLRVRVVKRVGERLAKSRIPVAVKGQKASEDVRQLFGIERAPRVRDGKAGPVQAAHASNLFLGVFNLVRVDGLLSLENGVDALGRNYGLALVTKNKRRVLTIEDDNVDLLAEIALAVNNVAGRNLIPVGQIGS